MDFRRRSSAAAAGSSLGSAEWQVKQHSGATVRTSGGRVAPCSRGNGAAIHVLDALSSHPTAPHITRQGGDPWAIAASSHRAGQAGGKPWVDLQLMHGRLRRISGNSGLEWNR